MMCAWQTRIRIGVDSAEDRALSKFTHLFGTIERKLFAEMMAFPKKTIADLKREHIARFDITARHFNAISIGLRGKISAIQELRGQYITDTEARILKSEKTIKSLRKKLNPTKKSKKEINRTALRFSIHQKMRHLGALKSKLAQMQAADADGKVRICFGSNALFRQQFHLEENGLKDHADWKKRWKLARNSQFSLVGSKDETAGNQSCQLSIQENGLYRLKIRLPDALKAHGKLLTLTDINLPYGEDEIKTALTLNTALSYRFIKDDKSWRVLISADVKEKPKESRRELGWIGVDINADYLAVTETDRHGNPINSWRLELNTYGKSSEQAKAIVGDCIKQLIKIAADSGKPIAIERLDFSRKKNDLAQENNKRYARMLSSFAYSQIIQTINARAFDAGIEVKAVNPAFTSLIGRYKFAGRYGISKHQAAALTIARRAENHSERPHAVMSAHVTSSLPVRNRDKHVWVFWREVLKEIRAHAARAKRASGSSGSREPSGNGRGDTDETRLRNSGAIPEPHVQKLFLDGIALEAAFAQVPF